MQCGKEAPQQPRGECRDDDLECIAREEVEESEAERLADAQSVTVLKHDKARNVDQEIADKHHEEQGDDRAIIAPQGSVTLIKEYVNSEWVRVRVVPQIRQ